MINKGNRKTIFIVMMCLLIITSCTIKNVYAASEEEELIAILNEYKDNFGNLEELKQVMDMIYSDVSSATKVDDTLKEKLILDIEALKNVTDINPLIVNTLEVELKSQIGNLEDSDLEELKYEISIIKNWVDEQVYDNYETNKNPSQQNNNTIVATTQNQNIANKALPETGKLTTAMGIVLLIAIGNGVYAIIKYKRYKGF